MQLRQNGNGEHTNGFTTHYDAHDKKPANKREMNKVHEIQMEKKLAWTNDDLTGNYIYFLLQ